MTIQDDDWRLQGQEKYLFGVELHKSRWIPGGPSNDHDHCEFCSVKFMAAVGSDELDHGYTTANRYHWICDQCFEDFQDRFQWKVAPRA
jgi:hypothetical protein